MVAILYIIAALMRPQRSKQDCLQIEFIYICLRGGKPVLITIITGIQDPFYDCNMPECHHQNKNIPGKTVSPLRSLQLCCSGSAFLEHKYIAVTVIAYSCDIVHY